MLNAKLILEHTRELNVLYVEDSVVLLKTTKELLSNYFHHIDTAVDGEEGLEKYLEYEKSKGNYYDLVITDINMPKLNGVEMSREIMKHNPLQAILITTAHNEPEYLLDALNLNVNGFLTKPINSEQLMQILYKISQSISDHNFFLNHIDMIEDLNLQLEEKNKILEVKNSELLAKNSELEKSFRMLDTMVEKVQLTHETETENRLPISDEEQIYMQEQIEHLIDDDLYELAELHDEIDVNIIHILSGKEEQEISKTLIKLSELFKRYGAVLQFYSFFNNLSAAMSNFSMTLETKPLPSDKGMVENIFMLVESFTYVLGKWQDHLSTSDMSKINSLDASLISDMNTIINMWEFQEEEVSEDDMDDIFDF